MYECMYVCMNEYVYSNTVIVEVVLVCCYLIFATVLAYTSCSIISPEVRSPSIGCEMYVCKYVCMYACTVCMYVRHYALRTYDTHGPRGAESAI